jgi:hypothetical protein
MTLACCCTLRRAQSFLLFQSAGDIHSELLPGIDCGGQGVKSPTVREKVVPDRALPDRRAFDTLI